jgi:NAD(P)-dependent dehydrogenase (short-subunit alcohol dehydrogenase family)
MSDSQPNPADQRCVLITGCSSGIGAALARELHRRGLKVYATARRPGSLAPLADEGIATLPLDVNDDSSIAAALAAVERDCGRLDMLVNNAGFSQVGAVVDLQREDLRAQYETNVISPVAVTRAALPLLRKAVAQSGSADMVMISSIVGLFTTPFAAAYCSSKAAVQSLTDGMRMELAPFGIRVISVQPGGVRSSFGDHAEEGLQLPPDSLFLPMEAGIRARAQAGQQGATPTETFVRPVVDALLRDRPPAIIRGGKGSRQLVWLKRLLPVGRFDALLSKRFGLDRFRPAN